MTTTETLSALPLYPIFGSYIPLSTASVQKLVGVNGLMPPLLAHIFGHYGCAGFTGLAINFESDARAFPVDYILGGGDLGYAVDQVAEQLNEEQPNSFIPFAGDLLGNYFLSSNAGDVWRWDHEEEWIDGINPIKLTNSLEEFFAGLK